MLRHSGPAVRARLTGALPGYIFAGETIKATSGVRRNVPKKDDRALRLEPSMIIRRRELLLGLAASGFAVESNAACNVEDRCRCYREVLDVRVGHLKRNRSFAAGRTRIHRV